MKTLIMAAVLVGILGMTVGCCNNPCNQPNPCNPCNQPAPCDPCAPPPCAPAPYMPPPCSPCG